MRVSYNQLLKLLAKTGNRNERIGIAGAAGGEDLVGAAIHNRATISHGLHIHADGVEMPYFAHFHGLESAGNIDPSCKSASLNVLSIHFFVIFVAAILIIAVTKIITFCEYPTQRLKKFTRIEKVMDAPSIIARLEEALGLKNDRSLAEYLGVGPSVISNWKSRVVVEDSPQGLERPPAYLYAANAVS